jgi:hypothetical protein
MAPAATDPVTAIDMALVWALATSTCPTVGALVMKGRDPSQASGPADFRTRPIETSRNARTTVGSKCVPAHARSSARAACGDIARL